MLKSKVLKQILAPEPLYHSTAKMDYIIILLLVFISGNPVFIGENKLEISLILISFFYLLLFLNRKCGLNQKFILISYGLLLILMIQTLTFTFMPWYTITGFCLRLFIAYAAIKLVKDFTVIYTSVIFYTCLTSLFFYSILIISHESALKLVDTLEPITNFINADGNINFIVHGYAVDTYGNMSKVVNYRNASYFWEACAFAGYIILAMLFLAFNKSRYTTLRYWKLLLIFTITLLTTISTAGYVLLPFVLVIHFFSNKPIKPMAMIAVILMIIPLYILFYNVDFIGKKIEKQAIEAVEGRSLSYKTRFGSLIFDLQYIKNRPLLGWGLHEKTRFMLHGGETFTGMSNGFTGFTVKFGIIGMLLILAGIYDSIYFFANDKKRAIFYLVLIILLLNTEMYLEYPMFLSLAFLKSKYFRYLPGF